MSKEQKKKIAVSDQDTSLRSQLTHHQQVATADIDAAVEMIIAGQEAMTRLKMVALQCTTERHWDNMQGMPRLNALGAQATARNCHLKVETFGSKIVDIERDEAGRLTYFAYECQGRISSPWGPPLDCQGRCDSDTPFHSIRGRGEQRRKLPAHEVSRVAISQQAQTLCVTRGVTQYLGLEKLTWDEVRAATSATTGRVNVDFSKPAAADSAPQDPPELPKPPTASTAAGGTPPAAPPPPADEPPTPTPRQRVWLHAQKCGITNGDGIRIAIDSVGVSDDSETWSESEADDICMALDALYAAGQDGQ
jgi:hypothetical protein